MKYYFVTIKRLSMEYISIAELKRIYNSKFSNCTTLSYAIELDSLNRLHSHSIIVLDKTPYYVNYRKHGWRIFLIEISQEDLYRTDIYIHKNQNSTYINEMEWFSRAKYEYLFI